MKKFIVTLLAVCLIAVTLVAPVSAASSDGWSFDWNWHNWFDWLPTQEEQAPESEPPEQEDSEPVEAQEYTIRYDANGGYWWSQYASPAISNIKSYTVEAGEIHKIISAPIRTCYTFQGWEAPDGTVYQPGEKITPTESMTLKAVWG